MLRTDDIAGVGAVRTLEHLLVDQLLQDFQGSPGGVDQIGERPADDAVLLAVVQQAHDVNPDPPGSW
jgi:hypothetical protein